MRHQRSLPPPCGEALQGSAQHSTVCRGSRLGRCTAAALWPISLPRARVRACVRACACWICLKLPGLQQAAASGRWQQWLQQTVGWASRGATRPCWSLRRRLRRRHNCRVCESSSRPRLPCSLCTLSARARACVHAFPLRGAYSCMCAACRSGLRRRGLNAAAEPHRAAADVASPGGQQGMRYGREAGTLRTARIAVRQ